MTEPRGPDQEPRWLRVLTSPAVERLAAYTLAMAILGWQAFGEEQAQPALVTAALSIMFYPTMSSRLRKRSQ